MAIKNASRLSVDEVLADLRCSDPMVGLTTIQVKDLQEKYGINTLTEEEKVNYSINTLLK